MNPSTCSCSISCRISCGPSDLTRSSHFFNMTYDMCLNSYVHYLQNFLVTLTTFYKTFQKDKNKYTFTCTTKFPKHQMQLNTSNNIYFQKPFKVAILINTHLVPHLWKIVSKTLNKNFQSLHFLHYIQLNKVKRTRHETQITKQWSFWPFLFYAHLHQLLSTL
jgi:hypothetical protein